MARTLIQILTIQNPSDHHIIHCTLSFPPHRDSIWCHGELIWLPYKPASQKAKDHIKYCNPCRSHRGLPPFSQSEVNNEPDSSTRSNKSKEANAPNSRSSDYHLSGSRSTTQLNSSNSSVCSKSQGADKSRADDMGKQNTDSSHYSKSEGEHKSHNEAVLEKYTDTSHKPNSQSAVKSRNDTVGKQNTDSSQHSRVTKQRAL